MGDNNNIDDMFNVDSLLSLLDEISQDEEQMKEVRAKASLKSEKREDANHSSYESSVENTFSKEAESITGSASEKEEVKKDIVNYNIEDYSAEIFSDQQLHEIALGIEHKVHVDEYADELLSGRQMRELRYGLERGLNISLYNNKYFRERQMKEIRIGLQDGLDVSSYAKLMYSATDMRNKRKALFIEKHKGNYENVSYDYDDKKTGIHIYVEPGLMEAGIVITTDLQERFTKEKLKNLMYAYDITEGFDDSLIPQNLANLPKGVKIPIMFGKKPKNGADGYFEYSFPCDESSRPKINENGTVDYSPTRVYKNVKRGDTVITFHPASPGENGMTVTGIEIEGLLGNDPEPIKSEDLVMSRDKKTYMAKKDGFVSITNGMITIMNNLTFKEDITSYNGQINFDGTVEVNGSIRDGAKIQATGDITVSGFVESSILNAGGNIIVTGGINADESGSYVAKGNIIAGFMENANVTAGGNVETGYILNSIVDAGGVVKTKGKKSLICGGSVTGKEGVYTGTLGSSAGTKTYICVGGDDTIIEEYNEVMKKLKHADEEVYKVHSVMEELAKKLGTINAQKDENFIKLQQILEQKKEEKALIDKELEEIEKKRIARNNLVVECLHDVYENVTVEINENKIVTKKAYPKATFRCQGRGILIDAPGNNNK